MAHYLPGPVGTSGEGHPIFILQEDDGQKRYVVRRPDGAFYCDQHGNLINPNAKSHGSVWAGLLIGGALGALLGPWGAVAGAAIGAGFGEAAERAKDA